MEVEKGRGKSNFEFLRGGGETPPTPLLSATPFYIDTKLIVQFRHPDMKLSSNWQKIRFRSRSPKKFRLNTFSSLGILAPRIMNKLMNIT